MIEIKLSPTLLPLRTTALPPLRTTAEVVHDSIVSNVDIWVGVIIAAAILGLIFGLVVRRALRVPVRIVEQARADGDWDHEPVGDVGPYQGWVR